MAVDVSSMVRIMRACKEEGKGERDLITRDLLGGAVLGSAAEVDLEMQAPVGWERRLDLLSGRMYLQRSGSGPVHRQIQDLNLPPPPSTALPEDSSGIDLRLPAASSCRAASDYRSVCTLEKVKLALDRAERESHSKQRNSGGSSRSPSSSTTSSSVKRRDDGGVEEADGPDSSGGGGGGMMAAGCPRCLLYVLIAKSDPRCPRCNSHVPVSGFHKRPRIDLNCTLNS